MKKAYLCISAVIMTLVLCISVFLGSFSVSVEAEEFTAGPETTITEEAPSGEDSENTSKENSVTEIQNQESSVETSDDQSGKEVLGEEDDLTAREKDSEKSILDENGTKEEESFLDDEGVDNDVDSVELTEEDMISTMALTPLTDKMSWGYKITPGATFNWPLYVEDNSGVKIAYCYNSTALWPAGPPAQYNDTYKQAYYKKGYLYYKIENATADDMNHYADNKNDPEMKRWVLRTVYNGFPYNASGIKNTYGLTNNEFREVTQAAIWHYTDNQSLSISIQELRRDFGARWPQNMINAYNDLIGNGATQLTTPPSDFQLDLFISQTQTDENLANPQWNEKLQNLLAVQLGGIGEEEMDIEVDKVWVGRTPTEPITVNLYANGRLFRSGQLTPDNNWTLTFFDIPKSTSITYTITEVTVPGYVTSIEGDAVKGFTITNTEVVTSRKVKISKVDVAGAEIAGADLEITELNGNKITDWTSAANQTKEVELLPGEYILNETNAPTGYKTAKSIRFCVEDDGNVKTFNEDTQAYETVTKVTMTDEYSDQSVKVSKVDIGGEEIEGAKLTITNNKDNAVVDDWESKAGETHESKLQPGEYTLTETTAPNGYEKAESIVFSVDKDGIVKVFNEKTNQFEEVKTITMTDEYSDQSVKVSKVDIGGEEIEGAKLTITNNKDNAVVDDWESKAGETHESKLQPGEYTLTETTAPNGYEKAESIVFSVDKDGIVKVFNEKTNQFEEVKTITMTDEYSDQSVKVSKVDIGGEEIEGAKLTIMSNKDNAVVDEWESKAGETHESKLQPGEYTLTETTAPNGYEKAESIVFSVDKDGVVKVFNEKTNQFEEVKTITMTDEYSDQSVKVSKVDIGGEEIEGAKLTIMSNKDNAVVDEWESKAGETHESKLQPGEYTLTETTAPNGYEKAESIVFNVDKDGVVKVYNKDKNAFEEVKQITMLDQYSNQTIIFSKTDVGGKEIAGAKLIITDKDGNKIDEWISEKDRSHSVNIKPGEYKLTEITAPSGYEVAESITFRVDHLGVVTVKDANTGSFVKVDKVTMIDQYAPTKVVKTGENNPILLMILLMIASVSLIIVLIVLRYKRKHT